VQCLVINVSATKHTVTIDVNDEVTASEKDPCFWRGFFFRML